MSQEQNSRLITAIEQQPTSEVRSALSAGADPNARKRITLTARVAGQQRSDTIVSESALVLGVMYQRLDVVRVLLDKGADIDAPVEWRLANYEQSWSAEVWDRARWMLRYTCSSIVDVVVGAITISSFFSNVQKQFADHFADERRFAMNQKGGVVTINNPSSLTDVLGFGKVREDLAILRLLLDRGARVSQASVDAARRLSEPAYARMLEEHLAAQQAATGGSPADDRLIEGIERSDLEQVQRALRDGASANARKKLTLSVNVNGSQKSESILAESALALAVLYGRSNIVRALLDGGASVHEEVEWKVPNWEDSWSLGGWGRTRWLLTYSCNSILDLAVGHVVVKSPFQNIMEEYSTMAASKDRIALNKNGGRVTIISPESQGDSMDMGKFQRKEEVVRLLLEHGAQITSTSLEKAKKLADSSCAEVLMRWLERPVSRTPAAGPTISASALADQQSRIQRLQTEMQAEHTKQTAIRTALDSRAERRARTQADATRARDELRREKAELEAKVAELRSRPPASASLRAELDRQVRSARQEVESLKTLNEHLRGILQQQEAKIQALQRAVPVAPAFVAEMPPAPPPPPPPPNVDTPNAVALYDYSPAATNQIRLNKGDYVVIKNRINEHWAMGKNLNTTMEGMLPLSYVRDMPPAAGLGPSGRWLGAAAPAMEPRSGGLGSPSRYV